MTVKSQYGDVTVTVEAFVATVEIHRPPANFFDSALIAALSDAYDDIDSDPTCRVIVLCSEGKHFCAGANFGSGQRAERAADEPAAPSLYMQAARLIDAKTPVIAVIQGASIGGGLGLACSADFRIGSSDARMAANFAQLGFHHGFGLTVTLPPIVGQQRALELLYTGRRITGDEAYSIGLLDRLVPPERLRDEANTLASEIASSAPLAVASIRATMRTGIGERYRAATEQEGREQALLQKTGDFQEGIRASSERRPPVFEGR